MERKFKNLSVFGTEAVARRIVWDDLTPSAEAALKLIANLGSVILGNLAAGKQNRGNYRENRKSPFHPVTIG